MWAGVEVDGPHHRTPDVVLALVVGGVADPHGPRPLVAGEVIERRFGKHALAVDAVHQLQVAALGLGDVGDEAEEVVGLPIETQGVERPERARRVAHPGVAVIPVTFAARCFRQRRGRGGDDRTGRGEGEPLQRQRAALQVAAPGMVGERATIEPVLPVVTRPAQSASRLLQCLGRGVFAPRQRDEPVLALLEQRASGRRRRLESDVEVRGQAQLLSDPGRRRQRLVVPLTGIRPLRRHPAVIEGRRAIHVHLHLAVHAADHPQQHVRRVVVGRGPAMRM